MRLSASIAALALVLGAVTLADLPTAALIPALAVLIAACGYQTGTLLADGDPA